MKTLICVACNLFLALNVFAQDQGDLIITFDGISEQKGELFIGIYEKDNFLRKPTIGKTIAVNPTNNQVTFENLDHGQYAVSVFQDLNGNKQFDMDQYGRPAEPWVMSGNVNPNQMPLFEDAKIKIDKSSHKITLTF